VLASLVLIAAALGAAPVAGEIPTPEVTVQYTERSRDGAQGALQLVQREHVEVKARLRRALGEQWPRPITVRLGADRAELEALADPDGRPPRWAVALAYPERDTMLLNARHLTEPRGPASVRHELYHLALGQLGRFPHWFHEGFADYQIGEDVDVVHYATMYRAVHSQRLLPFGDLAGGWPEHGDESALAYAQSISFTSFLAGRHAPAAFDELFERVRAGDPFELAFAKAFHASVESEEGAWKKTLERRYGTIPLATLISLLWAGTAALCVLAFVRRRAQKERNLRRMDEEAALEALLRLAAEPSAEPPPDEQPPPPPVLH